MSHLRVVLFTHPHCGLCVPVKNMLTILKCAPLFQKRPFLYHEVNIHAPGNEFWNSRYQLKIPVLHLYSRKLREEVYRKSILHDLEREFWNDTAWLDGWNDDKEHAWAKQELVLMDIDKKEMKYKHPDDLGRLIWGE